MPAEPKATLEKILQLLGFTATVEEHRMEEGILLDVKTEDSGRLIGRQGQTLSDLQYITNRLLFQQRESGFATLGFEANEAKSFAHGDAELADTLIVVDNQQANAKVFSVQISVEISI